MAEHAQNEDWAYWNSELELSRKAKGYDTWQTRAKKIIKRYRDERGDAAPDTNDQIRESKFNILWSNVQTLQPALFAKSPKPVVERRYLDRDDVGRTASVILERALLYELEDGGYASSVRKAVLDRLLPGRGVVWVRYEPKFAPIDTKTQETDQQPAEGEAPQEQVASESTCVDYIDWQDYETSSARTWEEVWWMSKRVYMTRDELVKRFGDKIGKAIPLDWAPGDQSKQGSASDVAGTNDKQRRARILEIWNKRERKVVWIAEKWSEQILDTKDDPLKLHDFWPVPKPLFATLTNDSLIPVPDYYEYQDQANELDDLTGRISALTKCIKIAGTYDGSINELQRIFQEGVENELIAVDNMAEFSQKAGANGMGHIWLLPIKDMAAVLNELYAAREQVKASLYEITGISDIIRGAESPGGAKTATEQRIKGQFASMRLNDMQAEVARFCRDTLRIMGEVIAEHFDPMTLYLVSGFAQYAKEQWPPAPPMIGQGAAPPTQPAMPGGPPPGMGAPGGGMPPPAAGMQPVDPVQAAAAKAEDMFKKAVALLRNDKLRGFRIDIETDSIIEADQQQMQQSRTELLGAISQFLPEAIQAGAAVPELKPLMARLLMFFLRGFKASRDIESAFEQFIDDVTKDAANPQPKPPSPEQIKAQAEMQKQAQENQRMQAQAQIDQQQRQADFQLTQQQHAMEMEKLGMQLQIRQQEFANDQQRAALEQRTAESKAAIDASLAQQGGQITAALAEHKAGLDIQTAEHKHDLSMEAAQAKADAAKKTNGAKSNA